MMKDDLKIYFAKVGLLSNNTIMAIRDFVNAAYTEGENRMWNGIHQRTSIEELEDKILANQLVVAQLDNSIAGIVVVHQTIDRQIAEFMMLAVSAQYKRRGIGGRLIEFAEAWAVEHGMTKMRLELLTPSNWKHPAKEIIKKWYRQLGYLPQGKEPFERGYPHLAPQLKTKCDFTMWTKSLV